MSKTFWVVEAAWQPPHYLQVEIFGSGIRKFGWTADVDKALQFSRQKDADLLLEGCLWGGVAELRKLVEGQGPSPRAVEHAYIQS